MTDNKEKEVSEQDRRIYESVVEKFESNKYDISFWIASRGFSNTKSLIEFLLQEKKNAEKMGLHDKLTGTYNRAAFEEFLGKELQESERSKIPFSLIIFDTDKFSSVNDTLGHIEGDEVLKKVSEILQNGFRKEDIVCRYGGDEFTVIVKAAGIQQKPVLDSKCKEINNKYKRYLHFLETKGLNIEGMGISFGMSNWEDGKTREKLIIEADQNMYERKQKNEK